MYKLRCVGYSPRPGLETISNIEQPTPNVQVMASLNIGRSGLDVGYSGQIRARFIPLCPLTSDLQLRAKILPTAWLVQSSK